jgi:hypothetical protein
MNTRKPHDHDRFEREAQEWLAQERAREEERRGLPLAPAGHDPAERAVAEYRLIARALRAPAMEPLPMDLAAQIVGHVSAVQALGERVERWMLRILGLLLAAIAAGAVGIYGASWAPAFAGLLPELSREAVGWGGLLVVCLAASFLGQGLGRWLLHGGLRTD